MSASFAGFPSSSPIGMTVTGTVNFVNASPTGTSTTPTFALQLTPGIGAGNVTVTSAVLGAGTYDNGTGVVTFANPAPTTVAPLATVSATVTYLQTTATVQATATTGGGNDSNAANNTATLTINGSAADMAATFTGFPVSAPVGTTVTGTVNFANTSTGIAVNPIVTLKLTPGLGAGNVAVNSAILGAGSYDNVSGVVTFAQPAPGTLAAQATLSASISYLQGTTTFNGTATANSLNDMNPANNTATVTVTGSAADMAATFTGFPASAPVGTMVTGVVNFVNTSVTGTAVSPVTSLQLTPGLGSGNVTVTSVILGAGTYNNATGVVTFANTTPTTLSAQGTISATVT
ncbi:MAG: hypothetical protein EOO28_36880, partial [Comamonadaceae bacterium]